MLTQSLFISLMIRVLNFTMIIDNDLLKQLSESSQLELESNSDYKDCSDFLHKLESIVQLFKVLDETEASDIKLDDHQTHLRDDIINYQPLISYLDKTPQFNSDMQMFEVPKVIESE